MKAKICIAIFAVVTAVALVMPMPSLASDATQQTLIDDLVRAYFAERECSYPLNGDRIAADLAKADLCPADLAKGGRYEKHLERSLMTFRADMGEMNVAARCGALAIRLGPPVTIRGKTLGVGWLADSVREDRRILRDIEHFLDYMASSSALSN